MARRRVIAMLSALISHAFGLTRRFAGQPELGYNGSTIRRAETWIG
jgi:hypothetical protein